MSKPILTTLLLLTLATLAVLVVVFWRQENLHKQELNLWKTQFNEAADRADAERLKRMELEKKDTK